jgi:hypothetical protein
MSHKAIHAPRDSTQHGVLSLVAATDTQSSDIFSSLSNIARPTVTFTGSIITAASPLTTYTSFSTSNFVSDGTTYQQLQGVPVVVSNSAQFSSLSAAGAFNTLSTGVVSGGAVSATTSATANDAAAATTTSAASTHKSSSSKTNTLIPAIVVPIVIILLASFAAFFFFMRRRHHRALEEEARFEKVKPHSATRSSPTDASSTRNLLSAGAGSSRNTDEKPKQRANVQVTPLSDSQAGGPARPPRPEEKDIPTSAIGIARSTSSESAVYPRPPQSAREMRGLPSDPRPGIRGINPALSGGDIIDSYADMRPSTAPNAGGRLPPTKSKDVMRTPLPLKPMGRPPPKNPNPQYTSNPFAGSPSSSHTAAPAPWQTSSPQTRNSPALSRAQADSPDGSYGLTEENLRIARLVNGSMPSTRQTPDNASISDIDERDHARAVRDDVSDISELDEDPEWMASVLDPPRGTGGRGTPMNGNGNGRGYAR